MPMTRSALLIFLSPALPAVACAVAPDDGSIAESTAVQSTAVTVVPAVKFEAESLALSGYAVVSCAGGSGGKCVQTTSTGTATATFGGPAGSYDVVVTYFDQPGGSATFNLVVDGVTKASWTANQDNGRTSFTAAQVALNTGSKIKIKGTANGTDLAELDMAEVAQEVQVTPSFAKNLLAAHDDLEDVAAGNGRFIAVGGDGTIRTSTDGVTFTTGLAGPTGPVNIVSVAYKSAFYLLSTSLSGANSIYTSTDGEAWTLVTANAPSGSKVRVVNGNFFLFGGQVVSTSTDAKTWTSTTLTAAGDLGEGFESNTVAFGNNLYVIDGTVNASNIDDAFDDGWTSTDGKTWTENSTGGAGGTEIAHADGKFVSIPDFFSFQSFATSVDGLTWTQSPPGTGTTGFTYMTLLYHDAFRAFTPLGQIASSKDGVAWSAIASATPGVNLQRAVFGSAQYVAVGDGGQILRTTDLASWTMDADYNGFSSVGAAYGLGKFVVGGYDEGNENSTNEIYYSSDNGATWQRGTLPSGSVVQVVRFLNGAFFAVHNFFTSAGASEYRILRSTDGVTWTSVATSVNPIGDIAFGGGHYVATPALFSSDGKTWKENGLTSANAPFAVVYAQGRFFGVSGSTTYTSADGSSWTAVGTAPNLSNNTLSFGLGQYVLASSGGTTPLGIYTSYDGSVWNLRTTSFALDIEFVNGRFLATPGDNTAITSENGITWKTCPTDTINNNQPVAFGNGTYLLGAESSTFSTAH